jgi:hypothetical protein
MHVLTFVKRQQYTISQEANMTDVAAFVEFIMRSGYLQPIRNMHFFWSGSSVKLVSSEIGS